MSKKREYIRLAKKAGIVSPDITYDRRAKGYSVAIGDVPNPNGRGYVSLYVGLYYDLNEAKERLDTDTRACVDRNIDKFPEIIDKVTIKYETVTMTDRDIAMNLLKSLALDGLDPEIAKQAKIAFRYVESLENQVDGNTTHPKGTYSSKLPDQPKKAIKWEQPDYREHPVYTFDVDCPYCGKHVTLERHSPRQPKHCGDDSCHQEHTRTLARERKRRQRQRDKANKG